MECLFCNESPQKGSLEHVFLSSLGGRLVSRMVTCQTCNNNFATGEKIEDSVAESFAIIRCALMIWSGRDQEPPYIPNAVEN